jgi:hypothetical protein
MSEVKGMGSPIVPPEFAGSKGEGASSGTKHSESGVVPMRWHPIVVDRGSRNLGGGEPFRQRAHDRDMLDE